MPLIGVEASAAAATPFALVAALILRLRRALFIGSYIEPSFSDGAVGTVRGGDVASAGRADGAVGSGGRCRFALVRQSGVPDLADPRTTTLNQRSQREAGHRAGEGVAADRQI